MRILVREGLRCCNFNQLPDAAGADPRTPVWVARACLCDDGELPAARFVSSEATSHTWHLELAEEAHWSRRWCFHAERYYQGPAFTHCWQDFQLWGVAWSLDGKVLEEFFLFLLLKKKVLGECQTAQEIHHWKRNRKSQHFVYNLCQLAFCTFQTNRSPMESQPPWEQAHSALEEITGSN